MEPESETEQAGDWLKVEFESLSKNEELARVIAAVFASRLDPTLEELDDIKTAVSEAVTNAIRHGYREEAGIVVMEMEIDGRTIHIHVTDGGVGIANISQAMEPMYSSDPEGESAGMGFSLMQSFMDTVYVESEPGKGTRVTMTKTINR
ncbi:MAG: anti-sigma F factor [bacterium]|nr:anti-sigma F factor [bacterium]